MFDELLNVTTVVYDTRTNNMVKQFLVSGLTPGQFYSFQIKAYNFNGLGLTWSD